MAAGTACRVAASDGVAGNLTFGHGGWLAATQARCSSYELELQSLQAERGLQAELAAVEGRRATSWQQRVMQVRRRRPVGRPATDAGGIRGAARARRSLRRRGSRQHMQLL